MERISYRESHTPVREIIPMLDANVAIANEITAPIAARRVPRLPTRSKPLASLGALRGSSPAMQALYAKIMRVAPTDATVLLTGESGTGKELVARSIHQLSGRSERNFGAVNCGAIPSDPVEAQP